jgi:hypothetical protein
VTFYVQKNLAHGPIRFGVSPRLTAEEIDADAGLSTGKSGEFLRRRTEGYFIADTKAVGAPAIPITPSITKMPFWHSMKPDGTARAWGFLALMAVGVIFVLLGIGVLVRKHSPAGWVEVVLGSAMIATPIILTAQKRRQIREQEEKERAEREERERRHRAMLEAYTSAVQHLRENPSEENLAAAKRERDALDLPYEIWSPLAKRTVLQIGFDALAREGSSASKEVSDLMTRASNAVGLEAADEAETKLDLNRALIWHLLADDRYGDAQEGSLSELRKGFQLADRDLPVESQLVEEFKMLRGVTSKNVPRPQCSGIRLQFREYCIHSTRGTLMSEKGAPRGTGSLFVTNKRVVIDVRKLVEIPLTQIDDVDVDVDANVLIIRAAKPHKPVLMQVEQPIYTAALIDIAGTIDDRPKGFA